MKTISVIGILLLSGCTQQQEYSDVDPGTRAALLGALLANQPRPAPINFYAMPVYQDRSFSCSRMGNTMSCY